MILRARIVLPLSRPPVEDGAVVVDGDRIVAVGRWSEWSGARDAVDLGDCLLLPGLVNAHCHLDYTSMAGLIPRPASFPDWIKTLVALKAGWTPEDYLRSWLEGMRMLALTGVTTVADEEAFPALLKEALPGTPLRVFTFLEVLGPRPGPPSAEEILQRALDAVPFPEGMRNAAWPMAYAVGGVNPGWWFGLAPHAPYSTTPALLEACGRAARERGWRVTSHVSESADEYEMFMYADGPMYDWLKGQRDLSDCGHGSPLRAYQALGLPRGSFLAVHQNYLWHDDAEVLARQGASVAHCPRSHRYFEHQRFPLETLSAAGVNVCLGTDSLVSVTRPRGGPLELNLFSEMQALLALNPRIAPETVLRLATVHGARALGLEGVVGEMRPGAFADLIVLEGSPPLGSAYEAAVRHTGPVRGSMVGGHWVVPPVPSRLVSEYPLLAKPGR